MRWHLDGTESSEVLQEHASLVFNAKPELSSEEGVNELEMSGQNLDKETGGMVGRVGDRDHAKTWKRRLIYLSHI